MYKTMKQNANPYLEQKIMSARPEQLIAYIYEYGANACAQRNADKARRAVQLLIDSLNFEVKDISVTFYDVYRYMHHLINRQKFDEARQIFTDLKQTWSRAFNVQ